MAHPSRVPATCAALRSAFGSEPFRAAEAANRGISRGDLRAAVTSGVAVPLHRGCYALAGPWEADSTQRHLLHARAVQLTVAGAIAARWTAALAHRLPSPLRSDGRPRYPCFFHPHRSGISAGVQFIAGEVDERDRDVVGTLVVTSAVRTALDVAADRPLAHALVVLDAACRRLALERVPEGWDLTQALAAESLRLEVLAVLGGTEGRRTDRTGARGIARAIALADPRAESPLESWSRAVFVDRGLPPAQLQLATRGESGVRYRADFGWPEQRVLGEADGSLKYVDRAALVAEKRREDDLRRAGWVLVRWTWAEITRTPDVVVARIRRALGA